MTDRPCKDCLTETMGNAARVKLRPAPYPGPRCATHHRVAALQRKAAARDKRIHDTYGLAAHEYDALLAYQDGTCAICLRATGKTRRLSVDHDHAQAKLDGHHTEKGCPTCVRGLLCRPCNRMLGHVRDDPSTLMRAAEYLTNWPSSLARNVWAARGSRSAGRGFSAAGVKASASSSERT